MAKKESTFLNMTLTLFAITAVAAIALGFVYNFTKGPIQAAKDKKLKEAINTVVPGADKGTIETDTVEVENKEIYFYTVTVDGEVIGTAVNTFTNNGFSGLMRVMVGFDANGVIIDSDILEHKETPGLGDKTDKKVSDWNNQFKGMDISLMKNQELKVTKDGGEVDAITAATISSRAYCDAIQRAYVTYIENSSPVTEETVVNEDEVETDIETETEVESNEGGNDNE